MDRRPTVVPSGTAHFWKNAAHCLVNPSATCVVHRSIHPLLPVRVSSSAGCSAHMSTAVIALLDLG